MMSVPPRSSTRTSTIESPPKVNASVVVPMIVAMHTPERNVSRRGKGTWTPKNSRRPAYFHQPITVMNPSMPMTVAIAEIGSSTVPLTGVPVSSPLESAFVRPL